jgi:hypothetical protein
MIDDIAVSPLSSECINPRSGGGVCILTSSTTVTALQVFPPPCFSHIEMCCIDIVVDGSKSIRLFNCYRPPHPNRSITAIKYISDMCDCINRLIPQNGTIILCGDFNFPTIDWSVDNAFRINDNCCTGIFLNLCYTHGLHQLVNSPTRQDNIIDLVLSNDINCILQVSVLPPFSTSDHNTVVFEILNPSDSDDCTFATYDFAKADWPQIKAYLGQVDFVHVLCGNDSVDVKFRNFYSLLYSCIERYVPLRMVKQCKASFVKYPTSIRKLLRNKTNAWRLYRRFRTAEALASFKLLASQCRSSIRNYIASREESLIDNSNIGAFYRYANQKLVGNSSINALKDASGVIITDPKGKADLLQQAFSGNFTFDNRCIPPMRSGGNNNNSVNKLTDVIFSPLLIERVIKKLNSKTKGGPDGVPPIFIINCSNELCLPLSILFSFCFENGFLPADWLKSYITPLFKKGLTTDPNNYRPIALTATMCKIMETIIKDQLLHFLLSEGSISKNQHAFLKAHSTATNLLECTQDWFLSLNSKWSTDIVYIDFSRAFDSIVFSKLLSKLEYYNIGGKLLHWIKSFLHNRSQCVVVEHNYSFVTDVISGVAQGSVIGPILFIIFINDIESVCHGATTLKLFADDAKLYTRVDICSSSISLQQSLSNLSAWAKTWQMSINIHKCSVLSTRNKGRPVNKAYYIDDCLLPNSVEAVDLGITISHDLSFNSHINKIVAKAHQRGSTFFRGFTSRNPLLVRKAFITYVRPLLEYNSIIWNPTQIHLIDLLESVQRKFTKRIPSLSTLTYPERLHKLDLLSLELRRLHFDLINYYKILNSLLPGNLKSHFIEYLPKLSSRSSMPYLQQPIKATDKYRSSFFFRNVKAWNVIPPAIRSLPSLGKFKRKILSIDFSSFMLGNSTRSN